MLCGKAAAPCGKVLAWNTPGVDGGGRYPGGPGLAAVHKPEILWMPAQVNSIIVIHPADQFTE
jgi:hypothetical protein